MNAKNSLKRISDHIYHDALDPCLDVKFVASSLLHLSFALSSLKVILCPFCCSIFESFHLRNRKNKKEFSSVKMILIWNRM